MAKVLRRPGFLKYLRKNTDSANLDELVKSLNNFEAPNSRGLRSWWKQGAENDAAWRALSLKDKFYYEIGQKTLPGSKFSKYAHLNPVERGKAIVKDFGWFNAVRPQGTGWRLGAGTTLSTGPTPLVRWFVPRAGIAGGVGTGGYFLWQWLFSGDNEQGEQ